MKTKCTRKGYRWIFSWSLDGQKFAIRMTPKEGILHKRKDSQVFHTNVGGQVRDWKGAVCPALDNWLSVGLSLP